MKLLKTFAILLAVIAVFGVAMFGLNFYTAPLIEANNAGAANERLNAVMPGGKAYEDITATLKDLPASVVKVNKETGGLGYVIECTATSQYTAGAPMDIVLGVDADGKICGVKLVSHSESLIFGEAYPDTYIGKDSALAGVEVYAGSTFSSNAFKGAVEEAMGVLTANNLIAAGVKSDAQILQEMIATVAPGYTKLLEASASGNIQLAFKAENEVGFAYIITEGDASYLALVNATGVCKVFDTQGADVTAAHAAVVTEAKAHAAQNQKSFAADFRSKIERLMPGATDVTAIEIDTFNTVAAAVSFTVDGESYYGFYSRSKGFGQMDVYFVLDANGAIAKMDAKELIFDEEYFFGFAGVNEPVYENGFVGITPDTWTGDNAVISGATMSTNAIKQSTADAFDSFKSINNGGEQ